MTDQTFRVKNGKIELSLHTNLARYGAGKTKSFPVAISSGETLGSLIQKFNIPSEEISMIIINGHLIKDLQTPLHHGDVIKIFGLVGGG